VKRSSPTSPSAGAGVRLMKSAVPKNRVEVIQGDITAQKVEAIVNAANNSLLGGGGVDGAIHRAAGPRLLDECRKLHGCATGSAKITHGYNLPAAWVIHTVGPIWHGGDHDEARLLAECYRSCLNLARETGIRIIAFPSISTGVYGYPVDRASKIAVAEIMSFLQHNELPERVLIVCFDALTYQTYLQHL
jgi:O-acetyl-ADP-ribose deacetylase (regulator of RNase III)